MNPSGIGFHGAYETVLKTCLLRSLEYISEGQRDTESGCSEVSGTLQEVSKSRRESQVVRTNLEKILLSATENFVIRSGKSPAHLSFSHASTGIFPGNCKCYITPD